MRSNPIVTSLRVQSVAQQFLLGTATTPRGEREGTLRSHLYMPWVHLHCGRNLLLKSGGRNRVWSPILPLAEKKKKRLGPGFFLLSPFQISFLPSFLPSFLVSLHLSFNDPSPGPFRRITAPLSQTCQSRNHRGDYYYESSTQQKTAIDIDGGDLSHGPVSVKNYILAFSQSHFFFLRARGRKVMIEIFSNGSELSSGSTLSPALFFEKSYNIANDGVGRVGPAGLR